MTAARDAARWASEIAATAFVSKPFGYDDLIRAVQRAIPPELIGQVASAPPRSQPWPPYPRNRVGRMTIGWE